MEPNIISPRDAVPQKLAKWFVDMNNLHHDAPTLPLWGPTTRSGVVTPVLQDLSGAGGSSTSHQLPQKMPSNEFQLSGTPWEARDTKSKNRFTHTILSLEQTMSTISTPQLPPSFRPTHWKEQVLTARRSVSKRLYGGRRRGGKGEAASPSLQRESSAATQRPPRQESRARPSPATQRATSRGLDGAAVGMSAAKDVAALGNHGLLASSHGASMESSTRARGIAGAKSSPALGFVVTILPKPLRLVLAVLLIAAFHLVVTFVCLEVFSRFLLSSVPHK